MEIKITKDGWQKMVVAIAIIIVLNLFFAYGVRTFYPLPDYNDFCGEEVYQTYQTQGECELANGEWQVWYEGAEGYCDTTTSCYEEYGKAADSYNRNMFIILIALGVISIVISILVTMASAVSYGLLFGGIIAMIIGTISYWSSMAGYIRLILLAVALALLIAVGCVKLKDKNGKNGKNASSSTGEIEKVEEKKETERTEEDGEENGMGMGTGLRM